MIKKILLLIAFILCTLSIWSESIKPIYGIKIERETSTSIIEQTEHFDKTFIVEIDAADVVDFKAGVKVTVKDKKNNKKIYKKRFPKSYLYYDSKWDVYIVGKGDALTQVILVRSKDGKEWILEIREKGIY